MTLTRWQVGGIILVSLLAGATLGATLSRSRPVASGKIDNLMIWNKPLSSGLNEGSGAEVGSHVDIYESHVVITTPRGWRIVSPASHFGPIWLKP